MKRKHLLLTLLLALAVPMAALAQVERTVTVNNGTDKYHRVPAYGGREINQWYRNEFVIDKAYLQEMAGKQITKMELYVAVPVPSSYMATSGSYAVRIREKGWATSGFRSNGGPMLPAQHGATGDQNADESPLVGGMGLLFALGVAYLVRKRDTED